MDSAGMFHSSHYAARATRSEFGDVSLNCDADFYPCLCEGSRPASYSLGKPDVTPGHEPELPRDGDPAQRRGDGRGGSAGIRCPGDGPADHQQVRAG